MKTLNRLIQLLLAIETRINRRIAYNKAKRAAVRVALNGCRV